MAGGVAARVSSEYSKPGVLMLSPQFNLPLHRELVIDLFAGGGGELRRGGAREDGCMTATSEHTA